MKNLAPATPPRILVVEDEPFIALHLRQQLTKLGYDVPHTVSTGEHALRRIAESPPELVLMDIRLKGQLDGIATAAAIPAHLRLPVIFLTAYAEEATLARAVGTNPDGYLLKPFSERELHAMIQVTLARRRAERAARTTLESRLRAQKMEALREFAGGLASEVDDLLGVLFGQLELIGAHAIVDPALASPVRDAFGEAIEKERLVHRLLDFAGRGALAPATVALPVLLREVSPRMAEVLGPRVRLRIKATHNLWKSWIDRARLTRVLVDLASNAGAAMPDGGSLTIEGQNATIGSDASEAAPSPGRYVMLRLSDTGTGMTETVLERAFEPFFTTKPETGSVGLGLSLVFGFVRQSGGHISVDSQPGSGTTVRLWLPAASRDPASAIPAASAPDRGWLMPDGAAARPRQSPPLPPSPPAEQADTLWQRTENTLFASVRLGSTARVYRLIVEQLPSGHTWDWAVWRPGEPAARHGQASSVVIAMAAAEAAARQCEADGVDHTAGR